MKKQNKPNLLQNARLDQQAGKATGSNDFQYDSKNQNKRSEFTEDQKSGRAMQGETYEDNRSQRTGQSEADTRTR